MALPKVVVVGRPNVGKSSLFNWLAGRRIAIVEPTPGVTRDRVSSLVSLGEGENARYVELVDTGGIGIVDRDDLSADVERQIGVALNEADLILFVVDARDGRMPLDEEVAERLRQIPKPIALIANKVDAPKLESGLEEEFRKLGFGEPLGVSAKENRHRQELIREILRRTPDTGEAPRDEAMRLAVVGRPNTGKSTFINTLAQEERMIVSEVAGTTRDSVDVRFELDGLTFVAIDTAGVRRHAKIRDSLDYFSIHRAQRSIRRADVVFLFLDPTQGITKLDKQLADYVAKEYKPCVFTINKWDLIVESAGREDAKEAMALVADSIRREFRTMSYQPLAFLTAKTGKNAKSLINHAQAMFKQARMKVSTGRLNRVLRRAVEAHSPAVRENRVPKIYFAQQVATEPPTLVLYVNRPSLFDATYQRYLLKVFREELPFKDIPIKMYLRARNTPEGPRDAVPGRDVRDRSESSLDAVPGSGSVSGSGSRGRKRDAEGSRGRFALDPSFGIDESGFDFEGEDDWDAEDQEVLFDETSDGD